MSMLYAGYELNRRLGSPAVAASRVTARALTRAPKPLAKTHTVRHLRAACEIAAKARPTHVHPEFGIASVPVGDMQVLVTERARWETPFATLINFHKGVPDQPKVLVVGPMSGHFTTLIRPTIRTLLPDHDVYVLDWHNARDIPADEGAFGFDQYIAHVQNALRRLGPGAHVVSVCQPAVPVLAAVSLLAADDDPAQPASMTLIAGPIDTRVNPNRINLMAERRPLSSFEKRLITTVPGRYAGAGRKVYPGFVQLAAFMSMNRKRHLIAHRDMYRDLVTGETEKAAATRDFYDEYGAVMDVPAEFYLETVQKVFMEHHFARGELVVAGRTVDPTAIARTALLTVEGAKDDICSPGQTEAAHALCPNVQRRGHHLQEGVGHYGVFSGSRWETEIYPVIRDFIAGS
ncbi:MAG: polyhydroxyalkanoate depolymerase [Sporichthyaceae bacterium]